jgi:hypothetical protein
MIRPLSLAPVADQATVRGATFDPDPMDAFSGGGPPSGGGPSGGGNPSGGGTDRDPVLFSPSGGGSVVQVKDGNGQPVPGEYTTSKPIPIGTKISIVASDPNGGMIATNEWANGSAYANYTSVSPVTIITGEQKLDKNVINNTSTYTFIVVPGKTTYEVVDDVTYVGGGSGSSTLTFTIAKPTGALSVSSPGTQGFFPGMTQEGVGVFAPIAIDATATTDVNTSGLFMFMKIVDTIYLAYTLADDTSHYRKNDNDKTEEDPPGENFNGKLLDGGSIGYPFEYHGATGGGSGGGSGGGDVEYYSGWFLPASSTMPTATSGTPEMVDYPLFAHAKSDKMLTIADTFSTYLMYKPAFSGVWIALSEIDWSTSVTAINSDGTWDGPDDQDLVPSSPKAPSGDALFPTWVNSGSNFLDMNKNPYRDGNPGP